MLLEMASLEGRGSLCGISRHWGSQGKVDTTPVQTAKRGALEAPVECERRNRSLRLWGHWSRCIGFFRTISLWQDSLGVSCPLQTVGRKGLSPVHSGER